MESIKASSVQLDTRWEPRLLGPLDKMMFDDVETWEIVVELGRGSSPISRGRGTRSCPAGVFPGAMRLFVPRYGFVDAVKVWAACRCTSPSSTTAGASRKAVFREGSLLYDEGYFLLREELWEPATYLSILKYIALGYSSLGKLAGALGMDKTNLTKYLSALEILGFVKHVAPYGQRRKGVYQAADNYTWFWLKFVLPNQSDMELGGRRGGGED
ncbi:AAA family ATPase [Pyrobaculum ferrireducens]|uniref:ATPase n=1 Tax=Pyrobaculum ferrireducens TaxID=1104324 RepID=G7VE83_9CREN|nr:ATP-binding protein [Pyrobaculum ferrireducens]AET34053.1 ATPase [Pyrobaculum ferrireducens]